MWRVFLFAIGTLALLCLVPVRCGVSLCWEEGFFGILILWVGGVQVYTRHIRFFRAGAGQYALQFFDMKNKLKNTVTIFPPPKQKKYARRLLEKQEIGKLLYLLFCRNHVQALEASVTLGGGDAAVLATTYGALCSIVPTVQMFLLSKNLKSNVELQVDFSAQHTSANVSCMVCDPLGKLILSAIHAVKRRKQNGKTSH